MKGVIIMVSSVAKALRSTGIVCAAGGLLCIFISLASRDDFWIYFSLLAIIPGSVCWGCGEIVQILYEIKQEVVNIRLGKSNESLVDRFSKGGRL